MQKIQARSDILPAFITPIQNEAVHAGGADAIRQDAHLSTNCIEYRLSVVIQKRQDPAAKAGESPPTSAGEAFSLSAGTYILAIQMSWGEKIDPSLSRKASWLPGMLYSFRSGAIFCQNQLPSRVKAGETSTVPKDCSPETPVNTQFSFRTSCRNTGCECLGIFLNFIFLWRHSNNAFAAS